MKNHFLGKNLKENTKKRINKFVMIKIQLANADNGIIKTITDNQYNGADQSINIVKVYEIDEDSEQYFDKLIEILTDISRDLGLDFGSNFDPEQLIFDVDWGLSYLPTEEEVNVKIKSLKGEIKELNEYKKELKAEIND
jgi:hypothetical protein